MSVDAPLHAATPLAAVAVGVLVIAYVTSATIQPLVRRYAIRHGFVDLPDEDRKLHGRPVPRLGGVGVFAGLAIAAFVGAAMDSAGHVMTLLPLVLAMAIGATILFAAGLVDDLYGVPPVAKLVVQSAAALIVCQFGFRVDNLLFPPDYLISLGFLAIPVTVLWIVGLSNAFNLVDGADGLAGSVGIIALVATAISAWILHDTTILWCSIALIGAMLGFLRFNLPPARMFLGDSGSLVVGFLLSILTVKGMSRHDGAVYAIAPIFALSYPLLDTGMSMLRRWLRGDPLSRADGRHIHHQFQALGLSPTRSLLVISGLSSIVALLGLSATFASPQLTIAIALAGMSLLLLILVYGARWLQYHELLAAGASITAIVRTGRSRLQDKIHAHDLARIIACANTTQELAAIIEDGAETFRFAHMQLRWGTTKQTPPLGIIASMQAAKLWAFDYPVTGRSGYRDPLFLSVWCGVNGARPAGAERVAEILAPAIEDWVVQHPDQVAPQSFEMDGRVLRFEARAPVADMPTRPGSRVSAPRSRISAPAPRANAPADLEVDISSGLPR